VSFGLGGVLIKKKELIHLLFFSKKLSKIMKKQKKILFKVIHRTADLIGLLLLVIAILFALRW
jgi:hypothetical protein